MTDRLDLVLIGGGRMGEALLAGLLATGTDPASVGVVEPVAERRAELEATHGVVTSADLLAADNVILAVKPHLTAEVAAEAAAAGATRALSVAAGVTLAALDAAMPNAAVIRAMPNTPALVGQGMAAIAPGSAAGDELEDQGAPGIPGAQVQPDPAQRNARGHLVSAGAKNTSCSRESALTRSWSRTAGLR